MNDQVGSNGILDRLMRGELGNQGGDGGGAGAGMVLNAATGALGINLVDTPGLLPDTSNQHLGLERLGLATTLDAPGYLGVGGILSEILNILKSTPITDHTEGVGASDGGGGGGDFGGGESSGGDYSGGGGSSGDSGIDTSGGSSGGDDFQVRSGGNFVGEGFQAEHVSDYSDIRPSATPDMRGGGDMGMSMD